MTEGPDPPALQISAGSTAPGPAQRRGACERRGRRRRDSRNDEPGGCGTWSDASWRALSRMIEPLARPEDLSAVPAMLPLPPGECNGPWLDRNVGSGSAGVLTRTGG